MGWPVPDAATDAVVYRPDGFGIDADGAFRGIVVSRTYRGDHFLVRLETPVTGTELHVVVRWQPVADMGEELRLTIDPDAIIPVDN